MIESSKEGTGNTNEQTRLLEKDRVAPVTTETTPPVARDVKEILKKFLEDINSNEGKVIREKAQQLVKPEDADLMRAMSENEQGESTEYQSAKERKNEFIVAMLAEYGDHGLTREHAEALYANLVEYMKLQAEQQVKRQSEEQGLSAEETGQANTPTPESTPPPVDRVEDVDTVNTDPAQSAEVTTNEQSGAKKEFEGFTAKKERVKTFREEFTKERITVSKARAKLSVKDWSVLEARNAGDSAVKLSPDAYVYWRAIESYEKKRAEYIGESVLRSLKEKRVSAEADAKARFEQSGMFETTRRFMHTLSGMNMEGIFGHGKIGRFVGRMFSVRSGIGAGLAGLGTYGLMAAPPLGMVALAARRVFGGAGLAMGLYDMAGLAQEAVTAKHFDKDEIEKFSLRELETRLAQREALAMYRGERIVEDPTYKSLFVEFNSRTRKEASDKKTEAIRGLDEMLREKQAKYAKLERKKKVAAIAGGAASIFAFQAMGRGGIAAVNELARTAKEQGKDLGLYLAEKAGDHPETAEILEKFGDEAEKAVKDSGMTPSILEKYLEEKPLIGPPDLEKITDWQPEWKHQAGGGAVPEIADTLPPESVIAESVAEKATGVVENGSHLWGTAKALVKSGAITDEQFREAWGNTMVRLPDGEIVHISKDNLVHPGTTITYISGENGATGHFIVEHARAGGFNAPPVEPEVVGQEQNYSKSYTEPSTEISSAPAHEATQALLPQEEAAWVAQNEYDLPFGTARFDVDSEGHIRGLLFERDGMALVPEDIGEMQQIAVEKLLRDDYRNIIAQASEQGERAWMPWYGASPYDLAPNNIGRVKEAALHLYLLHHIAESLPASATEKLQFVNDRIAEETENFPWPGKVLLQEEIAKPGARIHIQD